MSSIGDRLRYARERKNLKQTQVKEKTGIHNKTLSGYENGVSHPDIDSLNTLARLYEVSVDWITGNENNKKGSTIAEQTATIEPNMYEEFIIEIEKEFNIDLKDPADRQNLIEALRLVFQIRKKLN